MRHSVFSYATLMVSACFLSVPNTSLAKAVSQAPIPAFMAPNATKALLTDITSVGDSLIAVGKHGIVLTSQDGENWQQANVPVQSLLTSVTFADERTGWACGHDATILKTQDGGYNWQLQLYRPENDRPCLDLHFENDSTGFAVGAYGMFYRTSNGGDSWQAQFNDSLLYPEDRDYLNDLKNDDPEGYAIETASILPHFNQLSGYSGGVLLAAELGTLAKSTASVPSFTRFDEIYPGSFFDLKELKNGDLLAAGLRGNAFISKDRGESWQELDTQSQATINSILVTDFGAYMFSNSGVLLRYSNGKITKTVFPDGKALLAGVQYKGALIMVGEAGIKREELK